MKSVVATLSFFVIAITLLSGCQNTVKGLGEDTDRNVAAMRKEINSN